MDADAYSLQPIAYYHGLLHSKFGLPRQAGLVGDLPGEIHLCEAFRDGMACRGLEKFSHLWLIWSFSEVPEGQKAHTVRPPRLKGNTRMGVFATRSPFRPNRLGLSAVRLLSIEPGAILRVAGADLLDGTPIFDIKPYIPYADSIPEAEASYAAEAPAKLEVYWPAAIAQQLSERDRRLWTELLAQDPRPAYQKDPARVYGLSLGGRNLRFRVDGRLEVLSLETEPADD